MKEQISRKIEQTFFILVNLFFIASPILGSIVLAIAMAIAFFSYGVKNLEMSLVVFWLIYMFLKLFLLPILYSFPKNFPFIHSFLEKFKNELKFKLKVLGSTMFIDILIYLVNVMLLCFISGKFEFDTHHFLLVGFFWLIFGFGASTSYLMFLLLRRNR